MVQTVESFGGIDEKIEVLLLFVESVIETIGDFHNIILPPTAPNKPFLARI